MTPLTDAQLAAIAERADGPYPHRLGDYAFEADRDRRSLLRHITASAKRAAEAEQEIALLTDERAQARELSTMARERLAETSKELAAAQATIVQRVATIHGLMKIIDGHEAEVEDLAQRCDKATAQLAAARAPIARAVILTPETLGRLKEITADWGNTLAEIVDGAIVAGIRLWEQESQEMRESGIVVEKVGERQWKATFPALAPPAPEADDAR